MGRVILWTATVCCVLIALNTNASSFAYSYPPATPWPENESQDQVGEILSSGLIKKIAIDIKLMFKSIRELVIYIESNIKKGANEIIRPLVTDLLKQTKQDFKSLSKDIRNTVKDVLKKVNETKINLRDELMNLTIVETGKIIVDIKQIVKDNKYALKSSIVACLNMTKDPELYNELLQILYNYAQTKKDAMKVVKKIIINIIYDKYLELSDTLNQKLKEKINKLLDYTEKYIAKTPWTRYGKKGWEADNNPVESFIGKESEDIIKEGINLYIDNIFKNADIKIKNKLDNSIRVDKNLSITTGTIE